jgi:hypothetical protein
LVARLFAVLVSEDLVFVGVVVVIEIVGVLALAFIDVASAVVAWDEIIVVRFFVVVFKFVVFVVDLVSNGDESIEVWHGVSLLRIARSTATLV